MRSTIIALGQLAAFITFVALCASIPRAVDWSLKRRRILILAGYIVMIQLAIGLSQRDSWPFTNYRWMHGLANPGSELWRVGIFGVDEAGREWRVDPYAWRSISDWHLQFWFLRVFEKASPAERDDVLRLLYQRAEQDRAFVAEKGRLRQPSMLGPLTAPQWWMFDREPNAPRNRYRKIRVYRDAWVWKEKLETGGGVHRQLLGEWGPP